MRSPRESAEISPDRVRFEPQEEIPFANLFGSVVPFVFPTDEQHKEGRGAASVAGGLSYG